MLLTRALLPTKDIIQQQSKSIKNRFNLQQITQLKENYKP